MNDFINNVPESSNKKKELPFRVPENYFVDFSARLQTRLATVNKIIPQEKKGIIRYLKPALGLAASFALIFMLVYWPLKSYLPGYVAETNTVIEQESEIETLIPSFERIDENSFFSIIAEAFSGAEETEENFNDEELLNYISANVSDYELYLHTDN
jgi:hypothetical protein